MKRSLTDVLRRGFDNTVANWPLVVIRVVEAGLFIGIAIASLVAIAIPLVVSAKIGGWEHTKLEPDAIAQTLMILFAEHWPLLVYLLVLVTVVLTIFIAIHSAVEAGSARVCLDAERAAAISRTATRERFEAFSMERFLAGVREAWWRVFWIYNIAWTVSGLIILVPLLLGVVLILAIGANVAALVLGCLILLVMVAVLFVVFALTNLWIQKAIVLAAARGVAANEALRESRREIGADFARHAGIALILLVVGVMGAAFLSSFSSGLPIHDSSIDWQLLFLSPLALASGFLQSIFSAAVAAWYQASVAAIQQETSA